MSERIIVLLDMDCFYVQVEERDYPKIKGKPAAVVQYNTWKGGGIIAVNYEARALGVKRGMRGDEAKEKCPSIQLVQVPVQRGKADLTKYRNAGKEVVDVLCQFSDIVERASIDEAYIDFTSLIEEKIRCSTSDKLPTLDNLHSTWVVGHDQEHKDVSPQSTRENGLLAWLNLAEDSIGSEFNSESVRLGMAALICEEMRRKVLEETGFKCSAGISVNKMLAKLACGLHKPNQQTILPKQSVPVLWSGLALGKVRNLGGKLGESLKEDLNCKTMGDLAKFTQDQLRGKFDDKISHWLFSLGRGIDNEPVIARQLPKSIGCGKNFNGKDILNTKEKVHAWMKNLSEELSERLNEDQKSNERMAKTLTVHVRMDIEDKPVSSRSCPLPSYKSEAISKAALGLIVSTNATPSKEEKWHPPIRNISLSANKFEDLCATGTTKIKDIFKVVDPATARNNALKDMQSRKNSPAATKVLKEENKILESEKDNSKKVYKAEASPQSSFFLKFLTKRRDQKAESFESFSENEKKNEADEDDCEKIDDSSRSDVYDLSTDIDEGEDSDSAEVADLNQFEMSPVLKPKHRKSSMKESSTSQENESENIECVSGAHPSTSSTHISSLSDHVSVRDLFPDMSKVDWSLVEILPSPFKERVVAEVKKHHQELCKNGEKVEEVDLTTLENESEVVKNSVKNISSGNGPTFCRECNRKIPEVNSVEHADYHFAMELRKEQLKEVQNSIVSTTKLKQNGISASKKRKITKNKHLQTSESTTPKIDRFFKKK